MCSKTAMKIYLILVPLVVTTIAQDPAIQLEKAFNFLEDSTPVILKNIFPLEHQYQYDADDHIHDGEGMYSGSGGNYISFGYNGITVKENVTYDSSGSQGGITWKNKKIMPFFHGLWVSNQKNSSITSFFIKIKGTLTGPPTEHYTYTIPSFLTYFLPCYLRVSYAKLQYNNSPSTMPSFLYLDDYWTYDVTLSLDLDWSRTSGDYEATYKVSTSPGSILSGYIFYGLFSSSSSKETRNTKMTGNVFSLLQFADLACSLNQGISEDGCLNGYPIVNEDLSAEGCKCIEGWKGKYCNRAQVVERASHSEMEE